MRRGRIHDETLVSMSVTELCKRLKAMLRVLLERHSAGRPMWHLDNALGRTRRAIEPATARLEGWTPATQHESAGGSADASPNVWRDAWVSPLETRGHPGKQSYPQNRSSLVRCLLTSFPQRPSRWSRNAFGRCSARPAEQSGRSWPTPSSGADRASRAAPAPTRPAPASPCQHARMPTG
jgi:hypothetical protein